jgi:AraC family transcriptional regulator of adaptative response / DNA-3-methyladenine glycosylase II
MSRRAHFARRLLDDTGMAVADVAFASGFTSLRQFNRQMREVFRAAPSELRARRRRADRLAADGGLTMRLPFQPPFDWDAMAAFFASRAVPGVESVSGGVYRRTISLDGAPGMLEIHPGGEDHLLLRAHLPYWEGLIHVAGRAGRMAGTGASPDVRAPGAWGPFEAAVQAVVTQECDDPGQARAQLGRIAERFGPPVPGLTHGLRRLFPSAEVLAAGNLAELDLTPGTARTLTILSAGVASGQIALDHSASHADLMSSLTAVAGIQPATASQIALRLGH